MTKDVIIVGGGLSGLCLGIFLGKLGLSIVIIDKESISSRKNIQKDTRTTAIAEGTKDIFSSYGIWNKIRKYAEPIKNIKVFDRNNTNNIKFSNSKINSFLGYIVENKYLKKIFLKEISLNKNILLAENTSILDISISDDEALVYTNQKEYKGRLLVAADGKNSFVRKILNHNTFSKKYNRSALVVDLLHSKNHNNVAYEFFYNSGPLAILPMKKFQNKWFRSSIVWTNDSNYINSIKSINDSLFFKIIEERTKEHIGGVKKIFTKQSFPLSAHINLKFFNKRVVFVADAAHSIHPIAGQGWNLGMRDVETLSTLIYESMNLGIDIGSNFVTKKFHEKRFFDTFCLYHITDKLDMIFMNEQILIKKFRQLGVNFINSNNKINNLISNFAMGKRI
tara:strand:+ start:325 stop:1506 length:1182 start_codon:yes stop_codon:yes gene_type:complete